MFDSHRRRLSRQHFLTSVLFLLASFNHPPECAAQPAEKTPSIDPAHYQPSQSACYDERSQPQRCVPDFINVAFNLEVEVTNTCGVRQPTRFCVQTGHIGMGQTSKVCDVCDARVPAFAHPASHLTDFNNPDNETWWQSETMAEGIQYPQTVNLTLHMHKRYDITYVRLKFVSPRPESFVVYKKTKAEDDWIPWQYYSGSCRSTFKLQDKAPVLPGNEAAAQCTREFSDISPLTGGNIAFSTLEGRPSAQNFEESEVLQEWVTAEQIRISLVRMNTFGDEIFGDSRVLRSYYYGITDFAVGGRCKCNGHANRCVKSTGPGEEQLVCDCQHNTAGADCQQCAPLFLDRPWRRATSTEANECLPCNCNGLSNRCFFDAKLFENTDHGGHCIDCAGNTQGPHCENCLPDHWRRHGEHYCRPCQCNEIGAVDGQCDEGGQCRCKAGVGGQFCDRCEAGFYDFGTTGCKDCHCDANGSFNNTPNCSPSSGACACKENVEGQRCDKCKPSFFLLSASNSFGCSPCFCFGHSSVCSAAEGYFAVNMSSQFYENTEDWTGGSDRQLEDVQWAQVDRAAAVSQMDDYPVYLFAPPKYLGDQRHIYNKFIEFFLRVQLPNPGPSKKDVVVVGANGQELVLPIFAQGNPLPTVREQRYRFRVHFHPSLQWSPSLRETDFIAVLSNVSAFKIRGTFSRGDVGYLYNFTVQSAHSIPNGAVSEPANWVEQCKCPDAFVGQFCEACAPGYKRTLRFGGPLAKCIPCECHGHSDSCDSESGSCICQHSTAGDTCERCARGFYGDALSGTAEDCKKCDCPEDGPCMLMGDGDTLCTECPEGYAGRKCDICAEESFGNPAEGLPCQKCDCNGNTDSNAIGKCDTVSGECKRCIYHTTGWRCEMCMAGYWGDALLETKGDCRSCNCYAPGTLRPGQDFEALECRQTDGQCSCQPNVIGLRCDQCAPGFYNISSGNGCQPCGCDPLGSLEGGVCDLLTGQCQCKKGVTGRRCDQCAARHFGFSADGCKGCGCDPIGSETPDCDVARGQCLCRQNVEGRRCDQCSENRFNLRGGCPACDDCYALIQARKNDINGTMSELRENLDEIINNPITVNDREFDEHVQKVRADVETLHEKATKKLEGDDSHIRDQALSLKGQLAEADILVLALRDRLQQIDTNAAVVEGQLDRFGGDKEATHKELSVGVNYVQTQGEQHLTNAQEAFDRYGEKSQQLSGIAGESKQLSERQEQRRREILSLAEQIRKASRQSLSDANEAIFGASSTSQQISALLAEVQELEQRLNAIQQMAVEQSLETNQTHDSAAFILSGVESVRLPNVLSDDLVEQVKKAREEGTEALKTTRSEAEKQSELLGEADKMLAEAHEQLQSAREKQMNVDHSFDEVESFNVRTQAAFDLATKTWNDAKDSHDALSDFHSKVEQSRVDATEEMANLVDIEKEIEEAQATTSEAEEAVGDASQNAKEAAEVAEEAKMKAQNLAMESSKLTDATEQTTVRSTETKNMLDSLSTELDSVLATTKDFENQATSDTERSNEVAKKATLSEATSKSLQEKLSDSDKKLSAALDQLNSLDNVDDDQLDDVEKLLEAAERRYESSGSEAKMRERIRRAETEAVLQKRQIDALAKELENLRQIRDALPTRCYNLINLEQEGQ
uniref:Laminin-like protein lam-2 n=1 Tax=Globodera rostochiensis TaxID=31243 RepID=A0A914HV37_GLORO